MVRAGAESVKVEHTSRETLGKRVRFDDNQDYDADADEDDFDEDFDEDEDYDEEEDHDEDEDDDEFITQAVS